MSILTGMDLWDRIDPLAEELGVKVEARRKWREREIVPAHLHLKLLRLAPERGVLVLVVVAGDVSVELDEELGDKRGIEALRPVLLALRGPGPAGEEGLLAQELIDQGSEEALDLSLVMRGVGRERDRNEAEQLSHLSERLGEEVAAVVEVEPFGDAAEGPPLGVAFDRGVEAGDDACRVPLQAERVARDGPRC